MPIWRCSPRRFSRSGLPAVGAILLLAGLLLWRLDARLAAPPGEAALGGPFRLAASDGSSVGADSFAGRYRLLYFGYTHCRDVCPTTLAALASALQALGGRADRVQPLFVTLDPGRDTPAVLRTYLAAFTPRLLGLTGPPEALAAVARRYRVTSVIHPGSRDAEIDHSSVLYLMAPDGGFAAPIPADAPAVEMAADLARYLS